MAETVHQEPTTPAAEGQQNNERTFTQAEMNAIISAARRDMVGGTLYLVGRNAQTGELLPDATSCAMCRRLVINAGLSTVVIRNTETELSTVDVQDWVDLEDDVPDLR